MSAFTLSFCGFPIGQFNTKHMEPEDLACLRHVASNGKNLTFERTDPDTLPAMPKDYSQLADVKRERSIPDFWRNRPGYKASTAARRYR